MSFVTLGWLSAALFLLTAGAWILVLERERRRDERIRRELAHNLEQIRGIMR